jgi:hypothetical protein
MDFTRYNHKEILRPRNIIAAVGINDVPDGEVKIYLRSDTVYKK